MAPGSLITVGEQGINAGSGRPVGLLYLGDEQLPDGVQLAQHRVDSIDC